MKLAGRLLGLSLVLIVTAGSLTPGRASKDPTQEVPEGKSEKFFARRYLTEKEALDLQSKKSDRIETEIIDVSKKLKRKTQRQLRVSLYFDTYTVHKIFKEGTDDPYRYALQLKQPGQHKFMDLMYGVNRDGTVHRIDLMVYREPQGSEVKGRRFMRQFEGRSLRTSDFRVNLDVIHIVGATISSKAVARGSRKVLAILKGKGFTTG